MLEVAILLAQLQCSPNASGNTDCYDAQKGGAPVLKIEPNLFGDRCAIGTTNLAPKWHRKLSAQNLKKCKGWACSLARVFRTRSEM